MLQVIRSGLSQAWLVGLKLLSRVKRGHRVGNGIWVRNLKDTERPHSIVITSPVLGILIPEMAR